MGRIIYVLLASVLLLSILLFGCIPPDEVYYPGPPPEVIAEEQDMVIAIGAEPESLDPLKMQSSPAATVSEHMVERLIYLAEDGSLKPALAESWESSEDGLVWTFYLREEVSFHDGESFNAEAVKYNLDRFLGIGDFAGRDKAAFAFLLDRVEEIEVVDEYTVQVTLNEVFAPIIAHFSHSFIGMHSPASLKTLAAGDFVEAPVGTGPFKYVAWDRGDKIVMENNEDYWGEVPILDTVTFKFVPEASSRVIMLETGEVDAIMAVPPTEIDRLELEFDIHVVFQNSVRVMFIALNMEKEVFQDVRVRQALNHAVDRASIISTLFQGVGEPASAPVVPAVFGYTRVGPYEYDLERAKNLLTEAGYPDGFEIDMLHPSGRYVQDVVVAEAVQAMLADIGVTVNLRTYEWGTYLSTVRVSPDMADHHAHMLGWGTTTLDADYALYALFHSSQWPPAMNTSYYANDILDGLLDQARTSSDISFRENLYREAIEILWFDAPWIFLHNEGQVNAMRTNVRGLIHHPLETISAWKAYKIE